MIPQRTLEKILERNSGEVSQKVLLNESQEEVLREPPTDLLKTPEGTHGESPEGGISKGSFWQNHRKGNQSRIHKGKFCWIPKTKFPVESPEGNPGEIQSLECFLGVIPKWNSWTNPQKKLQKESPSENTGNSSNGIWGLRLQVMQMELLEESQETNIAGILRINLWKHPQREPYLRISRGSSCRNPMRQFHED